MRLACGLHDHAVSVDQMNPPVDASKSCWSTLLNLHCDAIGQQTHHARRLNPGNLLELLLALLHWNEKDVAPNISAENFHYLSAWHLIETTDGNVVAGKHAKAPISGSVAIDAAISKCGNRKQCGNAEGDSYPTGSLLRESTFANGNAPVRSTKLWLRTAIRERRVRSALKVEFFVACGSDIDASGKIQLFVLSVVSRH